MEIILPIGLIIITVIMMFKKTGFFNNYEMISKKYIVEKELNCSEELKIGEIIWLGSMATDIIVETEIGKTHYKMSNLIKEGYLKEIKNN